MYPRSFPHAIPVLPQGQRLQIQAEYSQHAGATVALAPRQALHRGAAYAPRLVTQASYLAQQPSSGAPAPYLTGTTILPQMKATPVGFAPTLAAVAPQASASPFVAAIADPELTDSDTLPSWDDLMARCEKKIEILRSRGDDVDLNSIALGDLENGTTNPFAKTRLFGKSPSDVRLTLYRDTNGWCGFCQKVWMYMEEKRLPYHLEKINLNAYGQKAEWFYKLNPKGLVPVVVLDGEVLVSSADIMKKLELAFPEPPLIDSNAGGFQRMEKLYHLSTNLTSAVLSSMLGTMPISHLESVLDEFNKELLVSPGPYLMSKFTMADIHFAPFMERGRACLLYCKGFNVCACPRWSAVANWMRAMESRTAYIGTQSDFFNLAHFMPPQVGKLAVEPTSLPFIAAVDGTDGSWKLPLAPSRLETLPSSPSGAVLAAMKMTANNERLVRFGQRTGAQGYTEAVDAALRMAALALLTEEPLLPPLPKIYFNSMDGRRAAAHACRYIRDRVGVPRDMRLDAARHLRAALNLVLQSLGFDPLVKDFEPAVRGSTTLTYTPTGSKPADDLRSMVKK